MSFLQVAEGEGLGGRAARESVTSAASNLPFGGSHSGGSLNYHRKWNGTSAIFHPSTPPPPSLEFSIKSFPVVIRFNADDASDASDARGHHRCCCCCCCCYSINNLFGYLMEWRHLYSMRIEYFATPLLLKTPVTPSTPSTPFDIVSIFFSPFSSSPLGSFILVGLFPFYCCCTSPCPSIHPLPPPPTI